MNITADITVNPPINSANEIISPKKNQTHTGPNILSSKTSILTSAAGKNGVAQVTKAIPRPIVNTPIINEI